MILQYDTWKVKGHARGGADIDPEIHAECACGGGRAAAPGEGRGDVSGDGRCLGRRGHRARRWRQIILGDADIAICGGVETCIEAVPIAAFAQGGMMSTDNDDPAAACRPFDKHREGMVFGEGGALMLIETEAHAKARGAPILARLMGCGYHPAIATTRFGPIRRGARR